MTDTRPNRLGLLSLFTPGQVAMIGLLLTMVALLGSILAFVWNMSSSFTSAKNAVDLERIRATGAEAVLSSRIDSTISGTASSLENINKNVGEIRADIRSLTAASTPNHK